jgi:acetolactate synthase small subunit
VFANSQEEKMENQLHALEDRWAVIQWQMDLYKDTDVPLLKVSQAATEHTSLTCSTSRERCRVRVWRLRKC